MKLSIAEAASSLGKSVRQVRYMIDNGRLPARKIGGRWVIDSDALPRSEGQRQAKQRRHDSLRQVVDEALDRSPRRAAKRFSFRDLRVVKLLLPVYRGCQALGDDHPSTTAVRLALEDLCRGCHRYLRGDKAEAYRSARDHASRAACALALLSTSPAQDLLDQLEHEAMPALASLIRRTERARAA